MASFSPAKGTRDWYGGETVVRNYIRDTLRAVFEAYGYDRLETPPIESQEALGFKGGGEIQKEVFRLKDQGGRDLALRFDQTVPLARYIASLSTLTLPFKRYAIGEVFRDGPTQPEQGRYRTFTQCDVDVLGIADMSAEAELFYLAGDAFERLGLGGVEINVNNRKILDGILDNAGVKPALRTPVIVALDKKDKIGTEGVRAELTDLTLYDEKRGFSEDTFRYLVDEFQKRGIGILEETETARRITEDLGRSSYETFLSAATEVDPSEFIALAGGYTTKGTKILSGEQVTKILQLTEARDTNADTLDFLRRQLGSKTGLEGISEVEQLLAFSEGAGQDIFFNPSLARGLDYYTGTTIEVFLKDRSIVPSAILAGGRFDNMVGDFVGDGDIPAVGFSFGLERLAMVLSEQRPFNQTVRQVYLVPIGVTIPQALEVAKKIRDQGINTDVELREGVKIGKAVKNADRGKIPYVAFLGENELTNGTITLKDMKSGQQREVDIASLNQEIK
jgi:histidyl-tRNA synthetase